MKSATGYAPQSTTSSSNSSCTLEFSDPDLTETDPQARRPVSASPIEPWLTLCQSYPASFRGNSRYVYISTASKLRCVWHAIAMHPLFRTGPKHVLSGRRTDKHADACLLRLATIIVVAAAATACPADQASVLLRLGRSFQHPGLNLPS